jgi:acetyl-CoA carboxylase carboxyl transferase subunit alpha
VRGVRSELRGLRRRISQRAAESDIWDAVELARHDERPYTLDYAERLLDDFTELHGDRMGAEDPAIVAGLGRFRGRTIALVGHQKGRDLKQRAYRNFGSARPEGYAKAVRVFELASRLGFPVLTLVDTQGAHPGLSSEQHGQAGAIARSMLAMARLDVPSVAVVIGEGGSGGALAIAVADRVLMMENSIYSVISPEGGAAILWRDADQRRKAAAAFKPTARFCLELGVIDGVVPEPSGGANRDHDRAARMLGDSIANAFETIEDEPAALRRHRRRARFRELGVWLETTITDDPDDEDDDELVALEEHDARR